MHPDERDAIQGVRATAQTSTRLAPARFRHRASAFTVAPVVTTSSTIATRPEMRARAWKAWATFARRAAVSGSDD